MILTITACITDYVYSDYWTCVYQLALHIRSNIICCVALYNNLLYLNNNALFHTIAELFSTINYEYLISKLSVSPAHNMSYALQKFIWKFVSTCINVFCNFIYKHPLVSIPRINQVTEPQCKYTGGSFLKGLLLLINCMSYVYKLINSNQNLGILYFVSYTCGILLSYIYICTV